MTSKIPPPTLEELNERIAAVEELRAAWQGLPSKVPLDIELYCLYAVRDDGALAEALKKIKTYKDIIREYRQRDLLQAAPQSLVSSEHQSPWMDIETAPKDVELLLGWWRSGLERKWEYASGLAGSTKGGWLHGQATHWMPLPAPPTHNSPPEERQCQKCGCATEGEEAWVDGKIWCHPCADETSHNHGEGDPS